MNENRSPTMNDAHVAVDRLVKLECYDPDERRPLAWTFRPDRMLELARANGLPADEYETAIQDPRTRGATTGAVIRALAGILVRGGVLVMRDGTPFATIQP